MKLIPLSSAVKQRSFDEAIIVDGDSIVIKTRDKIFHLFKFEHNNDSLTFTKNCIFSSLSKTNNYDKEVINLTDEIIDIVFRAILSGTDRSQSGKTNHSNGMTQSIDTLMFKGLTLDLAVQLTHSIEFDIVNSIVGVFPFIDSDSYIETPCTGQYIQNKFFIYVKFIKRQKGIYTNATDL